MHGNPVNVRHDYAKREKDPELGWWSISPAAYMRRPGRVDCGALARKMYQSKLLGCGEMGIQRRKRPAFTTVECRSLIVCGTQADVSRDTDSLVILEDGTHLRSQRNSDGSW